VSPTTASPFITRPKTLTTLRSKHWLLTYSTHRFPWVLWVFPTEYHLFFNQMIFKYTKYPNAAKEFLRFMMEEEQYGAWLQGAGGGTSRTPLAAYSKNPIWTVDPKHTPYRDSVKNMRPAGYAGSTGLCLCGCHGRLHC
jgi:hypothetical protein